MNDPLLKICAEVHSKCATLRSASRLLPDLAVADSDEMLGLMADEARRLAAALDAHRTGASAAAPNK